VADFTIKQGDTGSLSDTLSYVTSGGAVSPVVLTGASVQFMMRALASQQPLLLAGVTTVVDPATGAVMFTPAPQDTMVPGLYVASWIVTFGNGQQMTFPTVGYLTVSIEEGITSPGGAQLVGLPDVKDYLSIQANDRTHDAKLIRFIHAVRPLIENEVGPIIPKIFEEWHDGGQYFVQIRRRPSTGMGTTPILNLIGVDEYRGPVKYPLSIVQDPAHGSIYSVMMDPLGQVVRRTVGGGVIGFPPMPQSVHVFYQAGQSSVPPNVYEAALEAVRVNYQTTQQVGRGRRTMADEQDITGAPLGFFLPRRVHELLSPNRRAPSIA
jgi:hypothetical protein